MQKGTEFQRAVESEVTRRDVARVKDEVVNQATKEAAAPDPQALAVLPPQERAMVALNTSAAEERLRALVAASAEIKNVVDANGRNEAHRAAMALKNARVAVVNVGKVAREDATAFQRAVVAEVERLAAITADEEARLFGLRDAFDDKLAAEKAERERLAKERADAIAAAMSAIRNLPGGLLGASAAEISEVARALALKEITEQEFGDQLAAANDLVNAVGQQLHNMLGSAVARELAEAERQQELEKLRAEAAENKRKADEAEAQRLREEQERREELERSTKAQAEAMAAQKRQQEHMAEIKRVQTLGMTIGDARMVDEALAHARGFDPSTFGEMEPMANMARDLAVSNLEQRLARVLELEIPAVIDEAYTMHHERDHLMLLAREPEPELAMPSHAHLRAVHDIDWDEPPAGTLLADPQEQPWLPGPRAPFSEFVYNDVRAQRPDDSAAVNTFRAAVHELRKTRPDAEIREFLNEELNVMPARS